ncbi:MAG: hypothetical protein Q7R76_02940 [Candidatus Woesearchaeota archaeon]|nr:hypothetical protein [Candidatus Woesearchaeota archaeon]
MGPTPDLEPRDTLESLLAVMRWHPDEAKRLAAGKLAVSTYVQRGMYTALSILTVEENRDSLPAGIPEDAEKHLPAAARKVLQKKDTGELEVLALDTTLPDDIRRAAGEKLIELYVARGGDGGQYRLLNLVQNKYAPDETRVAAGKNLVEFDVEKGNYIEVLALSHNRKVPDEVRHAAEAGMDAALSAYITNCVEQGSYEHLYEESRTNKRIPAPHRIQIRAALGPAAEKAIEEHTRENEYLALKCMANERFLPKEVRKKAREKATSVASTWIRQNEHLRYRDQVVAFIADTALPETLRKKALSDFIRFQKDRDSYSNIRLTILDHDDLSPEMKAYGISYLLSQTWPQKPHASDFLWIARADVLPDNLRLRAVRKAVEFYVRSHDYAALDEHIMRGRNLPANASKQAERYLRNYAIAQAERVMGMR